MEPISRKGAFLSHPPGLPWSGATRRRSRGSAQTDMKLEIVLVLLTKIAWKFLPYTGNSGKAQKAAIFSV
jgi:hypothetical protein